MLGKRAKTAGSPQDGDPSESPCLRFALGENHPDSLRPAPVAFTALCSVKGARSPEWASNPAKERSQPESCKQTTEQETEHPLVYWSWAVDAGQQSFSAAGHCAFLGGTGFG